MKTILYDILKGIIIGIGSVMPGFSGGVMALAFNVYDRLIYAVSNFSKHPYKVLKDIWAIAIGICIGIITAIVSISLLLKHIPIPTILFFTGLIVGSIPNIYEKVKSNHYSPKQIVSFLLGFLLISLVIVLSIVYDSSKPDLVVVVGDIDVRELITLFLLGFITASTLIIPGISGSLILLALGYYQYILDFVLAFLKALLIFNTQGILGNLILIIIFGAGILVGLITLSKSIEIIINKYPKIFFSFVIGLLLASPFAIIYQMFFEYKEVINEARIANLIIGIMFLVLGAIGAYYLVKNEEKIKNVL